MSTELVVPPPPLWFTGADAVLAPDVVQVMAAWLAARRSAHTRRAYRGDLGAWTRWCAHVGIDPLAARRRHLQVWGAQLRTSGRAPASVARRLAAVSSWYRVLAGEDLITVVPTVDLDRPPVNVDDSAVLGLDLHAAAALLRTAERDGPRSHALVALLLLRALRLAEALALDVPDVTDTQRGHRVATITGKGERTRLAALPPAVTRPVDTLIADRTTGPIFATRTGTAGNPPGAYRGRPPAGPRRRTAEPRASPPTPCGTPPSLSPWTPARTSSTSRTWPDTPTRAPPAATTAPAAASTPPTPSPPSWTPGRRRSETECGFASRMRNQRMSGRPSGGLASVEPLLHGRDYRSLRSNGCHEGWRLSEWAHR